MWYLQDEGLPARRLENRRWTLVKEQYITCPHCGGDVPAMNRLGRKPLGIGVKIICDTLQDCQDITLAAEKLCCSRGYIYKVLGEQGLKPRDVIE